MKSTGTPEHNLRHCIYFDGLGEVRLDKYADGGYPILYYDGHNCTLCPDCAEKQFYADYEKDRPIGGDIFEEGPPEICVVCNTEIESAYGDPEENKILKNISDITRNLDCFGNINKDTLPERYINPFDKEKRLVSDDDILKRLRDYIEQYHDSVINPFTVIQAIQEDVSIITAPD